MGNFTGIFGKYLKHTSFYVLLKLVSGDTLMAMLKEDNEDDILIYFPLLVKSFSVVSDEGIGEAQSITPWIGVDNDKLFYIQKSQILILKPLAARFIPMYINLLKKYEFPEAFAKEQEQKAPKTKELERQPQTEEVNDVIAALERAFGLEDPDEKENVTNESKDNSKPETKSNDENIDNDSSKDNPDTSKGEN